MNMVYKYDIAVTINIDKISIDPIIALRKVVNFTDEEYISEVSIIYKNHDFRNDTLLVIFEVQSERDLIKTKWGSKKYKHSELYNIRLNIVKHIQNMEGEM